MWPEGVVVCSDSSTNPSRVIQYTDISRIELRAWTTAFDPRVHIALMLYPYIATNAEQWKIDERFGGKDEIAQMIIASHAHYEALHHL
jgi:hypothetical protein